MAEMLGRPEFRPGRKIDGHHGANVSYRKVWSADKLIVGQPRIEPRKEMLKPKMPSLRERRYLFEGYKTGQRSALQPRSGISKSLLGGVDSIPLDPPQPGFNDGSFLRAPPHQGRIRMELFEVAAYRNDVGNHRTAIEFEYWNHAIRIQGAERRRELFAVTQINLHGRQGNTLLSKKNTHATRAGCRCAVIKFHEDSLAVIVGSAKLPHHKLSKQRENGPAEAGAAPNTAGRGAARGRLWLAPGGARHRARPGR